MRENHDLPDCVWLRFVRFSRSTRKIKKAKMATHSRFCTWLVSRKVTQTRLSHANEIVGYYKKSPRRNGDSLDRRRVACVCDVIQVGFQTTSYFGEILLFGDGGQDF